MRALLFLLLSCAPASAADDAAISFQRSGSEVRRLTIAQIAAAVPPQVVKLQDQMRGNKAKTYKAFPVKDVVALAYGKDWGSFPETEASIVALDGYASMSSAAKLAEDGGWLAFEDVDTPGWEPIGRKSANPGPFYLVWAGDKQSRVNEYPWPYQIATINLVRFAERFPEVVPAGAKEGSPETRGFAIFKGQCLRCHAINTQGGKIGPDLNAPRSVTSYRTKAWIKSYVRQPSKYRYTEMPDHGHLSDRDLEDLYAYLRLKAKQPEKRDF